MATTSRFKALSSDVIIPELDDLIYKTEQAHTKLRRIEMAFHMSADAGTPLTYAVYLLGETAAALQDVVNELSDENSAAMSADANRPDRLGRDRARLD